MLYDEHNDNTCTLRLRIWQPEDDQPEDASCILQQQVNEPQLSGGFVKCWLECGTFGFMELAMQRAKDASVLLYERGIKSRREHYRLVCCGTRNPFCYFDVVDGVLYPSMAKLDVPRRPVGPRPNKAIQAIIDRFEAVSPNS